MAVPAEVDIPLYRGDDWVQPVTVTNRDTNQPFLTYFDNVTTAFIEVRANRDATPVVTFNSATGEITWGGAQFTLIKDKEFTDIPGGTYLFDMECTENGLTVTKVKGNIIITDDTTVL